MSGASVDVDLDGDMDIVIGRNENKRNLLLTNNNEQPGHLDCTPGMLPVLYESTYGVTLGDVNGDGSPDIFFANVGQNSLLFNNTRPSSQCSFDLDGDGDVDGLDLAGFIDQGFDAGDLEEFAGQFGRSDCMGE